MQNRVRLSRWGTEDERTVGYVRILKLLKSSWTDAMEVDYCLA